MAALLNNIELVAEEEEEEHDEETTAQEEDAQEEELSPEDRSMAITRRTRCFEGLEGKRMSYIFTTQLTCSNVMSTIITSRPIDTSTRRRSSKTSQSSSSNQQERAPQANGGGGGAAPPPPMHVYAQPCNPKKVKKKDGKYQAQLPSFRRHLPALPIPIHRLNQELMDERDKFMTQLHKERQEKTKLDNWAATKIQACYRGFRARPRVVTYEIRQRLNTVSSLRLDLSDMGDTLKRVSTSNAPPSTVNDNDEAVRPGSVTTATATSPWRKDIQSRAGKKRDFQAKMDEMHRAATLIQSIVKRYLTRIAFAHLLARHYDEVYLRAVVKIQGVFRGFRLRAKILTVVAKLQSQAVVQIQSLIRGIQARERVGTLKFEKNCEALRRSGKPLQFTLPSRTADIVHTNYLRCLFEHHQTRMHQEFKSSGWHEERMYLRIYKVAMKLHVQRRWLVRLNVKLPTTRQRKKRPQGVEITRKPSYLSVRLSRSNVNGASSGSSSPSTLTSGQRRQGASSSTSSSPTNSRPSSPMMARTTRTPMA